MALAAGTRIGPFEITARIGAGGMGEVYRARDSRLARDVAIKILPDAFAADADRLARFDREAKALASLNHPNIAQIYGVEATQGATALVMELVEGEDLAQRIARGPIPIEQALAIAQQIADALEAAHERGIIHRDLKPANIKVRDDGTVKVLDFGLAKALDPAAGPHSDLMNSPTITSPAVVGTMQGTILGTAAYMAPEQAKGYAVDKRADVWAFGVVLFEMLSGQQAFRGDTISDVLASVLKNDLNWSVLPADLPSPIMLLLRRCLNPDRRNRLRDIGEARIAIAEFLANPSAAAIAPPAPRSFRVWQIAAAAAVMAIALAAAVFLLWRASQDHAPPFRFVVAPPPGVSLVTSDRPSISVSPDGQKLVFAGSKDGVSGLYLRAAHEFEPRLMPGTEGASNPVFSPDGGRILFTSGTRIKLLELDGGVTQLVPQVTDARGMAWVDGATIVYTPEAIGGVHEASINGGAPRVLSTPDEKAGERTHRWPHVLPGGRWVLFTVGTIASPDNYDAARIDAIDRRTGERRVVFQNASMARYAPTGHLIFARAGSLFAVRFDPDSLKVTDPAVSVLQAVGGDSTTGAAHVAWGNDGTLGYLPGDVSAGPRQIAWVDRKGAVEPLPLPPALYNAVRISPDGTRAAIVTGTSGLTDIWIYVFARQTFTPLTSDGRNASPVWSADGTEVYFMSHDHGSRSSSVMRSSAAGGRPPVKVGALEWQGYLKHVSPDGKWALIDYYVFGSGEANVGRLLLEPGSKVEPLLASQHNEFGAALSPDGRYLAYQSEETGRSEIYVLDLSSRGGRWPISNAGGEEPMWSRDGRALYFQFLREFMTVAVDTRKGFTPGTPERLFEGIYDLRSDSATNSYDLTPDGTRFLMVRLADVESSGAVRMTTRWFDQLRAIKK